MEKILKTIRYFTLVILSASVLGCVSMIKPGYLPVSDGGNIRQYPWFTIQVPEGEGWYQIPRQDYSIHFGRDTKKEYHTFLISAIPTEVKGDWKNPTEFMVEMKKQKDLDSSRFKILENNFTLDNRFGEYCFRYYTKGEGQDAKGQFLIMEMNGYGILHPSIPGVYLDVNYSERYLTSDTPMADLSEAGKKFIDNFHPV